MANGEGGDGVADDVLLFTTHFTAFTSSLGLLGNLEGRLTSFSINYEIVHRTNTSI